jgi:glycerol-3-phosphate dehydrogenase subunit B
VPAVSRPRAYNARHIILATGGFRHGGLQAPSADYVVESVFGLPVQTGPEWFAPFYWDSHPYTRFGLRSDAELRPLRPDGRPIYANVSAVGGLLAGADRDGEGSREAIDLATAFKAVSQLELARPA